MNRSDERKQIGPGLRASRPNRDDDDDDMDGVMTADKGSNSTNDDPEDDDDEAMDEKNETAEPHAMRDAMTNRADQDAEEASEARQKSGNMGGMGMKGATQSIKGTNISDADEMKGPAQKVEKGRQKPPGKPAEIDGAHQGSGDGGMPRHFSNLAHGEREAKMTGAFQGQHGGASMAGEGFEAGGKMSKERAKGPSGMKR